MKTVNELNSEELNELRSRYYYQHLDNGSLYKAMGKKITDEEDIPLDIVKIYYEGTYFVVDDFWCNV
jgi:uncharacterized circularly permuted ATP-grasp superfamily protein